MKMSEEFKAKLIQHIEEDFESSMCDKDDTDGIHDSISAGVGHLEFELQPLSEDEMDEFLTLIETTVDSLIEEWERQQEEDE